MSELALGYVAATNQFLVALSPDTLPNTYGVDDDPVTALGSIDHAPDDDDLPGHAHSDSHTIYHHVREALYHISAEDPDVPAKFPENITDMSSISIIKHGPLITAKGIRAADLVIESEGASETDTLVVQYLPSGDAVDNTTLTFVSDDPAVATVDASGVVTAVALGSTTITITVTGLTLSTTASVDIVAPEGA